MLLIGHGADEVLVVDHEMLAEYVTEPYAKAMTHIITTYKPEILLYGATAIGRDLAPRIAARVHTGLTADCTGLEIDPESKLLLMTRPAFGGNIMATIVCENHRPQMATVRPGVMKALERTERTGAVTEVPVEFTPEDMNVTIREVIRETRQKSDITEAKILVSGGRGLGRPEGFEMLRELADALGGDIASSRAGVDAGWQPKDRQVGQTGKTVRPNLYVACGISGRSAPRRQGPRVHRRHQQDTDAPIFDVADLGVVGDVHAIVPSSRKLSANTRKRAVSSGRLSLMSPCYIISGRLTRAA